jgi:hypothetical protein
MGGIGNGGTGGTRVADAGRDAPASCAVMLTMPNQFYTSSDGPQRGQATSGRFYWSELESPNTYLHYTSSAAPQNQKYNFVLTANTDPWDVRVGNALLLSIRGGFTPALVAYDLQGMELGRRPADDIGPIDVDAATATAHYFWVPSGTPPMSPAIMKWSPPDMPTTEVSLPDIGADADIVGLMRIAGSRFVLASRRKVWLVDPGQATPLKLLFTTTADIDDIMVSPSADAVLVRVLDGLFGMTGRDLYSVLTPGTPLDLQKAIDALPSPPGCPAAGHHYAGAGTLYRDRYVYQAEGGIYAAQITPTGGVSAPARLTDLLLSWPVVVSDGALFAVRFEGFDWFYYRVGQL